MSDNESNRGDSNLPLVLVEFFSWWCWFGSTEDRRLVVKIDLGVRAKTHGLEVPVDHIDLALRNEEIFDKLRRCDILSVVRMIDLIRAGVFSFSLKPSPLSTYHPSFSIPYCQLILEWRCWSIAMAPTPSPSLRRSSRSWKCSRFRLQDPPLLPRPLLLICPRLPGFTVTTSTRNTRSRTSKPFLFHH